MKVKQVEYVLAVAEVGSFTVAARQCHTVQSALSHQVAQLESELGVTHQLTGVSTRRVHNAPRRSMRVVWPKTPSPATRALLGVAGGG